MNPLRARDALVIASTAKNGPRFHRRGPNGGKGPAGAQAVSRRYVAPHGVILYL